MSLSRYVGSANRNRSIAGVALIARIVVAACFFAFAHGAFGESHAQGDAGKLPPAVAPAVALGSCIPDQGGTPPPRRRAGAPPAGGEELDISDLAAFQSPTGVYRPLGDECFLGADLERTCEVGDQQCKEDHGTYVRDEFFFAAPIADPATGETHKVRIISDRSLDIVVERDSSDPLRFTFDVAGSDTPGEIRIDDPKCLGQSDCFVVRNVPDGFGLKNRAYARTRPLVAERNELTWGSAFVAGMPNLPKAIACYDVRKLNENKIHEVERNEGLCLAPLGWFLKPNGQDKTYYFYEQSAHKVAVPFGMRYVPRNVGWGGERTDMFETETEINDNRSKTLGLKTGLNILGIINTEVHNNTTTTAKRQDLSNEDVTYSQFEQKSVDYAVVLDRYNLYLVDKFKIAVTSAAKVFKKNRDADRRSASYSEASARRAIDDQYESLIEQFGTHVPFATTMGKRASQRQRYTKEAVQTLAEEGVSVSMGASVGVSMPAPDLGGSVDANFGVDSGSTKDHAKRLRQVLGKGWSGYDCIGGSNCNGKTEGTEVQPIFLDLMPISELLGPPFFMFSYPRVVGAADQERLKDFTMDDWLEFRDDLRKYIARVAFLTDPKDMPSNIVKNEYMRLSRFKQTGCTISTGRYVYPDGKPLWLASSKPYDGGLENCRVSDLTVTVGDQNLNTAKTKAVSASRAAVFPRPKFEESRPPQDRNETILVQGRISVKPTAQCGGSGVNMEKNTYASWSVKVWDGKRTDSFELSSEGLGPGEPTKKCYVNAQFEAVVEVGGAALILDAD